MKTANKILEEELPLAGQASPVTPQLMKLDGYRITSETEVPEEEFLMRMYDKPCLPRRDLTAVTGMEKCGKTFFTSMLMACCAQRQVLELERIREQPLKVMWYDTEQSRQSTKTIFTDRVGKMVSEDAVLDVNYLIYNVRACTYQERMDCLVAGIETYSPDLVIIDNVSDLLPSVNDADQSQRLVTQLMELATSGNCNIVVVIHLNRSGDKRNLRGWLGTEILHKAYEAFYCHQLADSDVYSVEQTLTRKYRIGEKLYYTINDDGLPEGTTKPEYLTNHDDETQVVKKSNVYNMPKSKVDTLNQAYIIRHNGSKGSSWEWDLQRLFRDAMNGCLMISQDMLKEKVMKLSNIVRSQYYEKVFRLAVEEHVVQTTLDKRGRVVVISTPT